MGGGDGGLLVVLEGAEGAGKTTHLRRLETHLRTAGRDVVALREPGGTPLGTAIRELLLDTASEIAPAAEALLFMASRAQIVVREIRPALASGRIVLLDRFFLSTYAYQIGGRGLAEDDVQSANALATGGLVPDLTLVLDVDPEEGLSRARERGAQDRMERSGREFHDRVAAAFRTYLTDAWQMRHPECGPIVRVEAGGGADEDTVFRRVLEPLARRWPETFPSSKGSQS